MLIKNLPEPFRQLAYNNQIYQKNLKNGEIQIGANKNEGGFNFYLSFEGDSFWTKVRIEDYQHKDVLETLEEKELEFYNQTDEIFSLDDVMNEINSL
jgi:hypothetical protein